MAKIDSSAGDDAVPLANACFICSLPPELLTHVLQYIAWAREPSQPLYIAVPTLRLVCCRWSTLITETPGLWARVDTDYPPAFNTRALTLSRNALIEVLLRDGSRGGLGSPIAEMLPHLHWAWKIHVWGPSNFGRLALHTGGKEFLTDLEIIITDIENDILDIFSEGPLPLQLQSVLVLGASLPWGALVLSGLTELKLGHAEVSPPSLSQIFIILQNSPGLTALMLTQMPSMMADCSPLHKPICLPALRTLTLSLDPQILFSILISSQAEKLRRVSLDYALPMNNTIRLSADAELEHTDLFRSHIVPIFQGQSYGILELSLIVDQALCILHCATLSGDGGASANVSVACPWPPGNSQLLLYSIVRETKAYLQSISLRINESVPSHLIREIHTALADPNGQNFPPVRELCTMAEAEVLESEITLLCADNPVLFPDMQFMNFETNGVTEAELLRFARGRAAVTNGAEDVACLKKLDFSINICHNTHDELVRLLGGDVISASRCLECRWEVVL